MHCFIFSLITLLLYVFVKTSKALHSLQQNWYNDGNRYIKWINNNLEKVFINFDMLFLIVILLGFFVSSNLQYILFSIFYLVCIFILTRKKEQVKPPLKYTSRVKRLLVTIYIIYLITGSFPIRLLLASQPTSVVMQVHSLQVFLFQSTTLILIMKNYPSIFKKR